MTQGYIITGTDTGIGKTVFAAMLTLALKATYWKPIQSGTEGGTDTQTVKILTGLSEAHFLQEKYLLNNPLSPHRAAELDNVAIDTTTLKILPTAQHLIIEGAGGLMVPVTRDTLYIDIFKQWQLPVILCARTGLGTINHTLLSIEALQRRDIPLHGLVFIGAENPDNMRTICDFSGAKNLGHLPLLEKLDAENLCTAFAQRFKWEDF